MKPFLLKTLIFVFACFSSGLTYCQTSINYGSNNGKYLSVNQTLIYYEEYGSGTPLLLLHGGFSSISNFQNTIGELSTTFHVIAVDLPGHGRSELPDSLSFQSLADDCSKLIDLLKLDSVYVSGFSLGAIVALDLAADRPDKVKKSVINAAAIDMNGYLSENAYFLTNVNPEMCKAPQMKWWLDDYKAKSPNATKWENYVNEFRKMFSSKPFITSIKLGQIKNPVLIMQGDQDIVSIDHGLMMYRKIKNAQFCVLPATGHFVLSTNADMVTKVTVAFLSN